MKVEQASNFKPKIGDRWMLKFEGKKYMVEAIPSQKSYNCEGCFLYDSATDTRCREKNWPCRNANLILKNLGVFKKGLLPSPWGGYPSIGYIGTDLYAARLSKYVGDGAILSIEVKGNTLQQVIDAWNERVCLG